MLYKTRGIVFKTTNYSESSVVVQVFTEKFGLQSYLINGIKKPKSKIKLNSLQPLHLLDMVVYHKSTGGIQRVSELRHQPVFLTIPYDIVKSSIVLFLNEVLYKSLKQHEADEVLFEFLFHAIEILDSVSVGLANFHLYFLLRLTRFLGFYPGQMIHPGNEQLLPLVRENNALEYDLEHCVKWFNSVEQTWSRASVNDGRLYQCVNSCNRV